MKKVFFTKNSLLAEMNVFLLTYTAVFHI